MTWRRTAGRLISSRNVYSDSAGDRYGHRRQRSAVCRQSAGRRISCFRWSQRRRRRARDTEAELHAAFIRLTDVLEMSGFAVRTLSAIIEVIAKAVGRLRVPLRSEAVACGLSLNEYVFLHTF